MAATFFQSVMEWRTTKSVSETVSGTVSERSRRQFWSADISGRQNSRSFFIPIYREGKTRAVFPSRYIGKPKLAQFSRPDISGKQNSRSFPVPIYRESKTRAVFPSRYIGKAKLAQFSRPDISGNQNSRSFPVPIYRETKTHAIFCHQMFALEAAVEAFRVQNAVHVGSARPSTRIWRIGPQSCKGFSIFSAAFEARPVTGGKSGYFVEEEKLGIVLPWL